MRLPRASLTLLLAPALLPIPPADADHLQDMQVTQRGVGLNHLVALGVSYAPTGQCCGGIFTWTTGDGASGSLPDGMTDGVYDGDASGQAHLSDGRLFIWERVLGADGRVQITIWYHYKSAGLRTVTWSDCCPDQSGSLQVIVL